jgi:hypothetical protein
LEALRKSGKELKFPDYNQYPWHVREIFEFYKATIYKEDLIDFAEGKLFKDNIVNAYLRILEKTNLVF